MSKKIKKVEDLLEDWLPLFPSQPDSVNQHRNIYAARKLITTCIDLVSVSSCPEDFGIKNGTKLLFDSCNRITCMDCFAHALSSEFQDKPDQIITAVTGMVGEVRVSMCDPEGKDAV